jgi:large subunit ribosomal protein L5
MKSLSLEHYTSIVQSDMLSKFAYKNVYGRNSLQNIYINNSDKQTVLDKRRVVYSLILLELLGGKRPGFTLARKSVAGFKLREGVVLGTKLCLRHKNIFSFLDQFQLQALPSSRGFSGLNISCFHNKSCVNIGVPDSFIFSDIEIERFKDKSFLNIGGFNISLNIPNTELKVLCCLLTSLRIPIKNYPINAKASKK